MKGSPALAQYKKLSDVPPPDLRAVLRSAKTMAVQRAIRWREGWQTQTVAGVLLAVRVDRAAAGMRLRVLVSPQDEWLLPADEKALLAALEIESYVVERLPIRPGADALLVTESYFSRSARELAAHASAA